MINPNPPLKGYTELRRDLMHLADEFNKQRLALIEVQGMIGKTILALVVASDHHFQKSLTERSADGKLKREYKTSDSISDNDPKTNTDVQSVADYHMPSRRNCGLCGKPGHTGPNCPDAHIIQKEKKGVAEMKAERKAARATLKETGKRGCSNCHRPGHRAKNCTESVLPKRKRGAK